MPQFSYRARNAQGGLVEGVLDCPDRSVAIRQIEQLQYMPVRIEPSPAGTGQEHVPQDAKSSAPAPIPSIIAPTPAAPTQRLKIPHNQLLIFTEQLGHLQKLA
jgi:type II secretory pathway component PulF